VRRRDDLGGFGRFECGKDLLGGLSVAEERRMVGRRLRRRLERGRDRLRRSADQSIPAGVDRVGPLGRIAQRHARYGREVRFPLHAARIGEDGSRRTLEGHHLQVAERLYGRHRCRECDLELAQSRRGARVDRENDAARRAGEPGYDRVEAVAVVGVFGAVKRHEIEGFRREGPQLA